MLPSLIRPCFPSHSPFKESQSSQLWPPNIQISLRNLLNTRVLPPHLAILSSSRPRGRMLSLCLKKKTLVPRRMAGNLAAPKPMTKAMEKPGCHGANTQPANHQPSNHLTNPPPTHQPTPEPTNHPTNPLTIQQTQNERYKANNTLHSLQVQTIADTPSILMDNIHQKTQQFGHA